MTARAPLAAVPTARVTGRVARIASHEIEVRGLRLRVGDALTVHGSAGDRDAEVVGVGPAGARALLFGTVDGLGKGDPVTRRPHGLGVVLGDGLVGRIVDGLGRPLDGSPPPPGELVQLDGAAPHPLRRRRIDRALPVGVRAVDTLCSVGRGQRMGIFAGSGVGKSSLLAMMARGTAADVVVLALVGERGREVREFLEDDLGPDGRDRTVAVVATSDEPTLLRIKAAALATRIAEWFADRGADVLLLMDSLTRLAMAQRELGLAAGEPPTARGYTPSVFTLLPRLVERAGTRENGTITGFYTVLVEGDDFDDPIADAARSVLDGHLVLDRRLADAGRWPAIDPLRSLSRLAERVTSPDQRTAARTLRAAIAAVDGVRDLVDVGAYAAGSNPAADRGLAMAPAIGAFLEQRSDEIADAGEAWAALEAITRNLGAA